MGSKRRFPAGIRARAIAACVRLREEERGALSILEMIIAATAAGVLFTAAFFFLLTGTNRLDDTEARRTTLSEEQVVIDRMAREVREAETLDLEGDTLDVTGPTGRIYYDCSGDTCTRRVFDPNTSTFGNPVTEIDDLNNDGLARFSESACYPGLNPCVATTSTVVIHIGIVPEGRTKPIVLERRVELRNAT